MTSTFLLPLAMGVTEGVGGDLMTDAFGIVAMVAMTPLIIIQLLGLVYGHRMKGAEKKAELPSFSPEELRAVTLFDEVFFNG
jgi:hypothetical protein